MKIFCISTSAASKNKALKDEVCMDRSAVYEVNGTITSRGPWYNVSWKDESKSGGVYLISAFIF